MSGDVGQETSVTSPPEDAVTTQVEGAETDGVVGAGQEDSEEQSTAQADEASVVT